MLMVETKSTLNPKQSSTWDTFFFFLRILFKAKHTVSNEFESEDNGGFNDQKCLDIYPTLHVHTQMIPFQSRDTSTPNTREQLNTNRLIFYSCLAQMG